MVFPTLAQSTGATNKKGIELKKQLGKEQNGKHCYAVIEMHHALILEYYMQLDVVSVILWSNWEKSREKQLVWFETRILHSGKETVYRKKDEHLYIIKKNEEKQEENSN